MRSQRPQNSRSRLGRIIRDIRGRIEEQPCWRIGKYSDNPLPSRLQMPCVQNRGPLPLISVTNPVPMPNVAGMICQAINGPC
ncbi:hypothetical protein ABH994_006502 [Bradyrhizobium yuanmingense]|uniref:Uncharacterized protein n=1 Tax=Bradyrhizobium yuanmingense TaxID=108015 RepID=A0ABV4GJN5_9BRAD